MHRPGSLLLLVSLAACGADEHVPPGSPDAALPVDAVPPDAAPALAFVAGPTLTMAPNPEVPLAGRLELATSRPTRVMITIDRPGGTFAVQLDDLASEHVLPVLGFRPDTTHAVTVTVTAADGESLAAAPFEVVTAPLPAGFPTFTVGTVTPGAMEPGVTIFPADRYLVILDEDGQVTWYADTTQFPGDVQRTPEGTLLFLLANRRGAVEMDMLGTVIRRWHPSNRSIG